MKSRALVTAFVGLAVAGAAVGAGATVGTTGNGTNGLANWGNGHKTAYQQYTPAPPTPTATATATVSPLPSLLPVAAVTPQHSQAFNDSIGLNSHLNFSGIENSSPNSTLNAIIALGVHHLRQGLIDGYRTTRFNYLTSSGVQIDVIVPHCNTGLANGTAGTAGINPGLAGSATNPTPSPYAGDQFFSASSFISDMNTAIGNQFVEDVEGCNEPNGAQQPGQGPYDDFWPTDIPLQVAALASPLAANTPNAIGYIDNAYIQGNLAGTYATPGPHGSGGSGQTNGIAHQHMSPNTDFSSSLSFLNIHVYPGQWPGYTSTDSNTASYVRSAYNGATSPTVNSAGAAYWITEEGYSHDSTGTDGAVWAPLPVLARWTPVLLADNLYNGFPRTYLFNDVDEFVGLGNYFRRFGLLQFGTGDFNSSSSGAAPTIQYNAVLNLLGQTLDPGDSGFSPTALSYSVTGGDANLRSMLFEKSNGVYVLALWKNQKDFTMIPTGATPNPIPTFIPTTAESLVVQVANQGFTVLNGAVQSAFDDNGSVNNTSLTTIPCGPSNTNNCWQLNVDTHLTLLQIAPAGFTAATALPSPPTIFPSSVPTAAPSPTSLPPTPAPTAPPVTPSIVDSQIAYTVTGSTATASWSSTPPPGQTEVACVDNQYQQTPVLPTGWTALYSNASSFGTALFYRIATAAEPLSVTFSVAAGSNITAVMFRVAGSNGVAPQWSHAQSGNAISTLTTAAVTPTSLYALNAACYDAVNGTSISTPTGYTALASRTGTYPGALFAGSLSSDTTTPQSTSVTTSNGTYTQQIDGYQLVFAAPTATPASTPTPTMTPGPLNIVASSFTFSSSAAPSQTSAVTDPLNTATLIATSSPSGIVTTSLSGSPTNSTLTVIPMASGTTTISITDGTRTDTLPVTVQAGQLTLGVNTTTFANSAASQQNITVTDTGNTGTIPSASSSPSGTVTTSYSGSLTSGTLIISPVAPGTSTITVTDGTRSATMTATVNAATPDYSNAMPGTTYPVTISALPLQPNITIAATVSCNSLSTATAIFGIAGISALNAGRCDGAANAVGPTYLHYYDQINNQQPSPATGLSTSPAYAEVFGSNDGVNVNLFVCPLPYTTNNCVQTQVADAALIAATSATAYIGTGQDGVARNMTGNGHIWGVSKYPLALSLREINAIAAAAVPDPYPSSSPPPAIMAYPSPMPAWPNALGWTTPINATKAATHIQSYDSASMSFYQSYAASYNSWAPVSTFTTAGAQGNGFTFSSNSDPTYTFTCSSGGYCGYSTGIGNIHIPNGTRTQSSGAGGCDCHLYVVEPLHWVPTSTNGITYVDIAPYQYELDLRNASTTAAGVGSNAASTTTFTGGGSIYASGASLFSTGSTGYYGGAPSSTTNGGWQPGTTYPARSGGYSTSPNNYGGSANYTNTAYTAGTISAYDLAQGQIAHETWLNMACANTQASGAWSSKTSVSDGPCQNETGIGGISGLGAAAGVGYKYGEILWLGRTLAQICNGSATITPSTVCTSGSDAVTYGLSLPQVMYAISLSQYGAVVMDTMYTYYRYTFQSYIATGGSEWNLIASLYSLPSTTNAYGVSGYTLNMTLPLNYLNGNLHAINRCVIDGSC